MAEEHATELGGGSLTLEVRESNVAAIALYDSLGLSRVDRRAHYYPDGEDAVVMKKRIRG